MVQSTLFPERATNMVRAKEAIPNATKVRFDGPEYSPKHDDERLSGQILRVFNAMKNGGWFTLDELNGITGDPHASISAQMRHLRKARFGSHLVEKRNRGERAHGLFEYRLTVKV